MSFLEILRDDIEKFNDGNISKEAILGLLNRDYFNIKDLPLLLSNYTQDYLEEFAQIAAKMNVKHFGRAVTLFTPMYISNYCANSCIYCSFSAQNKIERKQLLPIDIENEIDQIQREGIKHILVLTGEAPNVTTFKYLKDSLIQISKRFSSVGIEVYPLSQLEYKELIENNLIDSLTIYQETYNEELYKILHKKGPKSDFNYRLETPDRACKEGIHALTIGALLGLDNFKREAYSLALHLKYLQKKYPETELSVSFPRMRPQEGEYKPEFPVNDKELAQLIIAFRLIFPSVGITMSTREPESIRDGLIPLGVTKVSAGVSTSVGGHSDGESSTQFEIADNRSVKEMCESLKLKGFQPVMHNWNLRLSTISGE